MDKLAEGFLLASQLQHGNSVVLVVFESTLILSRPHFFEARAFSLALLPLSIKELFFFEVAFLRGLHPDPRLLAGSPLSDKLDFRVAKHAEAVSPVGRELADKLPARSSFSPHSFFAIIPGLADVSRFRRLDAADSFCEFS